jgi:hypothetical protein
VLPLCHEATHLTLFAALALRGAGDRPRRAPTDGDEELPINATPAERAIASEQIRTRLVDDPPPLGPIRNVAEYEPATGVLIRYPLGIGYAVIKEMAEDVTVYVVVSSANLSAAIANFLAAGVDTTRRNGW